MVLAGPVVGNKPNTLLILHLKNADSTYYGYALNNADVLFDDTIPDAVDTFYLDLKEPTPFVYIISNDTSKRFSGYLDIGKNEIMLDLQHPRHPVFVNSPINEEFLFWRNKSDSVLAITYTPEALRFENPSAQRDSIRSLLRLRMRELDRIEYQTRFNNIPSFLTLGFIHFYLQRLHAEKEKATFTKTELLTLFKKLPGGFKKYPTYAECLLLFDLDIAITPELAPPLYAPQ